ncbi:MAG TPA: PAS domain-containing protein [Geminicoccaceae bacterium]|nr:PAS domain-containing protein [Geminicoccaceae bacterium]
MAPEPDSDVAKLKASEERYRTLVEAIGAIVWTTRADGTVEDMVGWRELTGQTPDQVWGFGWLDALHAEDRERTRAAWLRATAAGQPYDVEYRVRGVDGRYRWYNARGVPVRGDGGRVREFVGVCIDVDDRRRAEAALQVSQERLALAQEAGRVGNWDWDLDTGASTWSASLYRLLGLDPERAPPTGETFEGCVHPDDRAKVAEEAQTAIRGERPLDTEFRVVRPDGTIGWLASRGEVVRDEAGRGCSSG